MWLSYAADQQELRNRRSTQEQRERSHFSVADSASFLNIYKNFISPLVQGARVIIFPVSRPEAQSSEFSVLEEARRRMIWRARRNILAGIIGGIAVAGTVSNVMAQMSDPSRVGCEYREEQGCTVIQYMYMIGLHALTTVSTVASSFILSEALEGLMCASDMPEVTSPRDRGVQTGICQGAFWGSYGATLLGSNICFPAQIGAALMSAAGTTICLADVATLDAVHVSESEAQSTREQEERRRTREEASDLFSENSSVEYGSEQAVREHTGSSADEIGSENEAEEDFVEYSGIH